MFPEINTASFVNLFSSIRPVPSVTSLQCVFNCEEVCKINGCDERRNTHLVPKAHESVQPTDEQSIRVEGKNEVADNETRARALQCSPLGSDDLVG